MSYDFLTLKNVDGNVLKHWQAKFLEDTSLGNANEIDDVGIIEMLQDGKYPWGFGHNVIIIDDILDSGSTVQKINEEINNFSSIFNESNLFHYFLVSKYPRFSNMYTPKKYFAPISIDDKWIVFPWEQ